MLRHSSFQNLSLTPVVTAAVTSVMIFGLLTFFQPQLRSTAAGRGAPSRPSPTEAAVTTSLRIPELSVPPAALGEEEATIRVVKAAQPAVVAILVFSKMPRVAQPRVQFFPFGQNPFEPFPFPRDPGEKDQGGKRQVGGGSGFFVSADGIVATNKHVIDFENAELQVQTAEGKKYTAKVLGSDPRLDVAFLKVEGKDFRYLTFGDSNKLEPGQTVIAIGNALDEFRNTITKGIVSGLNRRIVAGNGFTTELIEEAVQTDAAINPGNSGGPLLDLRGRIVGLNTAVSERGQSLGFAIPSNTVKRDFEMITKLGRIVRPFLGVRYQIITEEIIRKNQLKVDHGALIVRGADRSELAVAPGSPAEKVGLVENDILLEIENQRIDEEHSLSSLIGRHAPDDEVRIKVLHAGEERIVTVKLDEMK